jgi:tetratricopeptide (TPR) repeat protein
VVVSISAVLFFSFLAFPSTASRQNPFLIKGIEEYKDESYEEAIELLKEARKADPHSSAAAFFLGLAYKQVIDYPNALKHLQDAVTLHPRIKEAAVELIDVALQLKKVGLAKKWIEVAEREKIYPAKIAFLKGIALRKEGKNMEAIESFKRAMSLDRTLMQAAEFQIALCYLSERKLKAAKERFQAAVLFDPRSDLASYARRYQDLVEERMFIERPLRVTLGAFGQYDTNVVLQPIETALAPDITDAESRVLTTTLRADYVPILEGPWLFNAQYAFYGSFHDKFSTTHDVISNGIYIAPGYNFGRYALNIAANYNHALVRDPSYKKYLSYLSVGPLFRVLVHQNHLLEFFSGYVSQEYYPSPLTPEEDRDSEGLSAYVSWIWSFGKEGFFNLRYDYTNDNTDGVNWENEGHRFSANVTIPLTPKFKLQLGGQAFMQDFKNTHTFFEVKREDSVYRGSVGLTWEFYRNTDLVLQYATTRADSNMAIYDYERDLYTAGIEYRF